MAKKKPTNTEKQAIDDPMMVFAEAMIFGGPDTIERSEARGQAELVESEVLPTDLNGGKIEDYEKIGIVFGDVCDGDIMFQEVTLPDGWKKVRTDHSMWSDLIDDKGRRRAGIFYKGSFYDRKAHMNLNRRISVDCYEHKFKAIATDGEKDLFEVEHGGEYDGREEARKQCEQWLNENHPDWKDVTAYWDD